MEKTDWGKTFRNVVVSLLAFAALLLCIFVIYFARLSASVISNIEEIQNTPPKYSLDSIIAFEEQWESNDPDSYVIRVSEIVLPPGPIALAVEDGNVVEVQSITCFPKCSKVEINGKDTSVYTIEGIFALAKDCVRDSSSGRCDLEFDLLWGYPLYIFWQPNFCFSECGYGLRVEELLLDEIEIPADFIQLPE